MLIKREMYLSKIRKYYDLNLIKVLTGIRRAGKSKLLLQIVEELQRAGIDSRHIIQINFEDIDFEYLNSAARLNDFVKSRMKDENKHYLFLDEIQHVKEFEKALASLQATQNCSIFITGSNSRLLSGDMATLLVGRTVEFPIFTFTYKEACDYRALLGKPEDPNFFFDYLKWGGFPQRFDFETDHEIKQYLDGLYEGIISKDILKRNSEIESYKFKTVCSYILANAGKEFSSVRITDFFNTVNGKNKIEIEKKSIYNYLDRMEKAFFISRVKRFDLGGKEILRTIEKQYAVDLGLRTINTNLVNYEDTFFLENLIYNELITRGYEVYTGKTYKGEVDFVVIREGKKAFLQVAYLLVNNATIDREFGAFSAIRDASPKIVLSLDRIDLSHDGVLHLNIPDFLLGKVDFPIA